MSYDSTAWPLEGRSGLPGTIAYLRDTYPAPTWREHRNFGELAAFWLQVHASLRDQGNQLQQITQAFRDGTLEANAFQQAFVPRFNQFLQHLEGHHQIEDAAYFPKFRALDPRMQHGFDLLESDHHLIHGAVLTSLDAARQLVIALPRGERRGRCPRWLFRRDRPVDPAAGAASGGRGGSCDPRAPPTWRTQRRITPTLKHAAHHYPERFNGPNAIPSRLTR